MQKKQLLHLNLENRQTYGQRYGYGKWQKVHQRANLIKTNWKQNLNIHSKSDERKKNLYFQIELCKRPHVQSKFNVQPKTMSEINVLCLYGLRYGRAKKQEKTSAESHENKMILPSYKKREKKMAKMQQLCHFKFPFRCDEQSVQFGVTIKMLQ